MTKLRQNLGLVLCLSALLFSTVSAEQETDDGLDINFDQLDAVMKQGTQYTVVAGDSLSKIAERFYGSHSLWVAIMNANAGKMRGDPMNIHPGSKIEIPSLDDALANNELSEEDSYLPGEEAYLAGEGDGAADLGLGDANSALEGKARQPLMANAKWIYTEGVARAIRREYLTFESAGRIAFLDPKLKEGDRVRKGQVLAYQEQSRPVASMASANAQLASANAQVVTANTQLSTAQSQVSDAHAQLVRAQTQLTVAEASRMEANANLQLAQRTFQRFSTLLKQKSASQQEYDEAQAKLVAAQAGVRRAVGQINSAKADINVAKTGIVTAKNGVNSARAGVTTAKAGIANAKAGLGTAQVTRKESYLIAPINALVARINIEQGYYYSPQYLQTQSEQQVFNTAPIILIDPSRFEVSINLPADHYNTVRVGADAYIDITNLNASLEERLPNEATGPKKALNKYKIRGRIHSISPVLDTDLRNFLVTIRTTVGQQLLRDGENVSLWIKRTPQPRQQAKSN